MAEREEEIRLVADTNIIISALLKDDSFIAGLIKSGYFQVYYPDYGLKEIEAYNSYIISKRERASARQSFDYALKFVMESIIVVPEELYLSRIKEAYGLMKDIDEKDTPFLALALQLRCPLWSNDKHFREVGTVETLRTEDISRLADEIKWKL